MFLIDYKDKNCKKLFTGCFKIKNKIILYHRGILQHLKSSPKCFYMENDNKAGNSSLFPALLSFSQHVEK